MDSSVKFLRVGRHIMKNRYSRWIVSSILSVAIVTAVFMMATYMHPGYTYGFFLWVVACWINASYLLMKRVGQ